MFEVFGLYGLCTALVQAEAIGLKLGSCADVIGGSSQFYLIFKFFGFR
jgi:hypothetical protein